MANPTAWARAQSGGIGGNVVRTMIADDREEFTMRVQVYEQLMAMQASRRQLMKGAAGAVAAIAAGGPMALSSGPAYAADSVVAQIMKIPGAGN